MHWAKTLQKKGHMVVGEVKEKSPFGYKSALTRYQQLEWLDGWADVISIHTNPMWGGSFDWLKEARTLTKKPILAKGFHDTIFDVETALACGANYILTVGWCPNKLCWHECETVDELFESQASMVVWNARNPRTGELRKEKLNDIVNINKCKLNHSPICQASRITKASDVNPSVEAVLIGEGLYNEIEFP